MVVDLVKDPSSIKNVGARIFHKIHYGIGCVQKDL